MSTSQYLIKIYDPETNKLIKTFNSLDEAKEFSINKSRSMILLALCSNLIYENYRWKRSSQDEKSPKINQIDSNTNEIIKTYDNIDQIIKEFRISRKSLRNAIKTYSISKGYYWTLF